MGNKPIKDESFRNRSLNRLSFFENGKNPISKKKIKKTNLQKNKIIPKKIKKSKSFQKSSKFFQKKNNFDFLKKKEQKNPNFDNSLKFCEDFIKIFFVHNLNPNLKFQSNFFHDNNSDVLNEENFRFKKLKRNFLNLEKNLNFFSEENFKNEIQYFIDTLKKNEKFVKKNSEKNFFLNLKKKNGKKDLFAFQKNIIQNLEKKKLEKKILKKILEILIIIKIIGGTI